MGFDFKATLEKMSDTRYARVRHILVEEKGEEGRAKLEEAKAEIGGDLDKFSEVAEKISTCTSAVSRFQEFVSAGALFVANLSPVEPAIGRSIHCDIVYTSTGCKEEKLWLRTVSSRYTPAHSFHFLGRARKLILP